MRRRSKPAPIDPSAFIRANLPLAEVPTIPGLRLHRANASSGLWRLTANEGFGSPYWAYAWAGGLALARYLLDYPDVVAGRRVLDFGTGSGLVAIITAKAGARTVTATDTDAYAVAACALNAETNNASVSSIQTDAMTAVPDVDIVLAGDVFYAPDVAERSLRFLTLCVDAGIEVLIGDPRRAFLPEARCRSIAEYDVRDVGSSAVATRSAVFVFDDAEPGLARRALGENAL